jgi:hypothetical protein
MTKRSLSMRRTRRKPRVGPGATFSGPASFPPEPLRKSSHNLSIASPNWPHKWSHVSVADRRFETLRSDVLTAPFSQRVGRTDFRRGANSAGRLGAAERALGRRLFRRAGEASLDGADRGGARARVTTSLRAGLEGETEAGRRVSALRVVPTGDPARKLRTVREASGGARCE